MLDFLGALEPWDWFVAGGLLLVIEVIAPGVFMLWLGLAALLVGLLSWIVPWPWQAQFIAFAISAVAMIPLYIRLSFGGRTDQPFLNQRGQALVGRVFTLDRPIVDGAGTVRVDDSLWRVTGPDIPAGRRIKVVSIDGAALHVEQVAEP